ncbi:MAG: Ig-like domain-containing protein [Nitrospiraceae bacterium]|nr:Ig-like domain-containing protein [Nitrospiraceae bacterium]
MKRIFSAIIVMLIFSVFLAGCGCGGSEVWLVSIAVSPADPAIVPGTTQPFTATGTYSDNTTRDITTAATWSSSDQNVATVSNASGSEGWAAGVRTGAATITATADGVSGSTSLTVLPVLVSISVTPADRSLDIGATQQYTATGTYSDNSTKDLSGVVTWSSSAEAIATISNAAGSTGLLAAVSAGQATVTATAGTVSGSTGLTVNPPVAPPVLPVLVSISVTPADRSLDIGATQQYTATGTYSDNSTKDLSGVVTWSSSAEAIATISNAAGSRGFATAVSAGQVSVFATLGSISGSAALTVNPVIPPVPPVTLVSIKVTPENLWTGFGKTIPYAATGTFSDGSTKDITTDAVWSSSKPEIATISNDAGAKGLATTDHKIGVTVITATSGAVSGSTTLFDP